MNPPVTDTLDLFLVRFLAFPLLGDGFARSSPSLALANSSPESVSTTGSVVGMFGVVFEGRNRGVLC